jgi:hypothetical protein
MPPQPARSGAWGRRTDECITRRASTAGASGSVLRSARDAFSSQQASVGRGRPTGCPGV